MKKLFALVLALLILVMPVCVLAGDNGVLQPDIGEGTIVVIGNEEVNTAFIEPNYYPDYDAADDAADDVAPKTGDFSMLPQMLMAAASVGTLAVALKRTK